MADSRGVFDLGVEMPDVLVLDTSAISVMLFEDQETHPDYTAFLARAVAEGPNAHHRLRSCHQVSSDSSWGDRPSLIRPPPLGPKIRKTEPVDP